MTFYTNKAAVYFEMKDYENCIAECDKAIQKSKEGYYDFDKLGKALARKGNAKLQQSLFDEAIELFNQSLLEKNDYAVKELLKKAQKTKQEEEEKSYINPEIAEELRKEGNKHFEKNEYPQAIKVYNEAIKRNPQGIAIYSNRAYAYIKLMEPVMALKDAEKCIQLDPNFVRGYSRKAQCHLLMKEYHKALAAYDNGLKIDPENKECREGKANTMQKINMSAYAGGENEEERLRHAMADPEIQLLMRDPRIVQVLKDLQENPASAQGALRDPFISEAINKLIAAGVLKMG